MQASEKAAHAAHAATVADKMQPIITLVKVLQIREDGPFVQSYQALLEPRLLTVPHMQQLLLVVDASKDSVAARLHLLKYRGAPVSASVCLPFTAACTSSR